MEKTEVEPFHHYLNTISTSIKFTKELEKSEQLTFLDVSVQQMEDGSLATSVYRKPTHTDRYLQYSSHHPSMCRRNSCINRIKLCCLLCIGVMV